MKSYFFECVIELAKSFRDRDAKAILRCVKSMLPIRIVSQITFAKNWGGCRIIWNNPRSLDEKLFVLHCGEYHNNAKVTMCSDKYRVREYICGCGYPHLLTELYGVYDDAKDIDFESLPDSFALKCNHGCGYNIIVRDKKKLDVKKARKQLSEWLSVNYGIRSAERVYTGIQPRILVESLIKTADGSLPTDYKFMASFGKVICCLLVIEREGDVKLMLVDKNFDRLDYIHETESFKAYKGEDYKKFRPASYGEMWEISGALSKEFPFVRVDLYDSDGSVYFGELTFSPHGCIHDYFTREGNYWIGSQIELVKGK